MMRKLITAGMLALAIAASGCSSLTKKPAPASRYTPAPASQVQQLAQAVVAVKPAVVAVASVPPAVSAVQATSPAQPSSFKSLQPHTKFAKGAGYGMAREYKDRNKAQFVAMLRDPKQMRVSCELLVRQMVEAHPELPFENCEGAAAEILRNSDYTAIACRNEMLRDNSLTVTNNNGSTFSTWHRTCLAGERVLAYKGKPIASTECANVFVPVSAPAPQSVAIRPLAPTNACSATNWTFETRGVPKSRLSAEQKETATTLIAAAKASASNNAKNPAAFKGPRVSRTMGERLYYKSSGSDVIGIRLLDPQTLEISEDLGKITQVNGVASRQLTDEQHKKIVETIWPPNYESATSSGGLQRNWVFPEEWSGNICRKMVATEISLP